jgi:hypothetical protein
MKNTESNFEEKQYDKIINKNKKEQKRLKKEILNLNSSQRDINCSNNSNSSLS